LPPFLEIHFPFLTPGFLFVKNVVLANRFPHYLKV
jgi:hypothetical protein